MPGSWVDAEQMVALFYTNSPKKPEEADIADMLAMAAANQGLPDNGPEFERAFRVLRSQLSVDVDEGVTISDNRQSGWKEWLPEAKSAMRELPPRWYAYQKYLRAEQDADPHDLGSLGKSTDRIVGLLADPRRDHPSVSRKGLVLGDVQSGKTRTYAALMNKAADYGYRLFVVLTSNNEKLRWQTQERIYSDFVGKDVKRVTVGLGRYAAGRLPQVFALTGEDDFIGSSGKVLGGLPRPTWGDKRPYVAVLKKEPNVLRKFNKWLSDKDFDRDLPVLVIDDESDYASVNSSKPENAPTTINALLRELVSISRRTSYVAVTATPFANVFIDDEDEGDLFPEDFIHILPTPDAYIGARKLFGDLDNPPENNGSVHLLDEDELAEWLPLSHRKEYRFDAHGVTELDDQVKYAVDCFLNACVLRPYAENERQSMLIHMSRFAPVQEQIADMVDEYVGSLITALKFHAYAGDPRIARLHHAYETEYASRGQVGDMTWDRTLNAMRILTERLQVRLVNYMDEQWNQGHIADRETNLWNRKHQVSDEPAKDECTIYVGGNQLSRGMTLKGLICSVFYRNVTAADTLLQMGRWFGYRKGYEDLQRIWLLERSVADYRYASSIVDDLKSTAERMHGFGQTPKQFGIAIKRNPNKGVRITGATKMRNAVEGGAELLAVFDLEGQNIESVKLGLDENRIAANDAALEPLIAACADLPRTGPEQSPIHVFEHVPAAAVTAFLSAYRAGYGDNYFGPTLLEYKDKDKELDTSKAAAYARTQQEANPSLEWNVAFVCGAGQSIPSVDFPWRQVERASSYDAERNLFRISGGSMRLAGTSDVYRVARILSPGTIPDKMSGSERNYALTKYFGETPTLMLYRVHIKQNKTRNPHPVPDGGNGLLAAKIVIPTDEAKPRHTRGDAYFYNTVATRNAVEAMRGQETDESDEA